MTIKKAVYYDVWCDDGRACNDRNGVVAGKSFVGVNKATAVRMAKQAGWWIDARYRAQCPECCKLVAKGKR